jgi:hypothetical protein
MNDLCRIFAVGLAALAMQGAWPISPALARHMSDCCSDLDARIADLESSAALRGNRNVSLSISGYVAQEITWWDDGRDSDVYLHGLGPTQATNIKFTGQANIAPGWSAGYALRLQNLDANAFGHNAATGAAMNQYLSDFDQGLNVHMSYWYLQSAKLGRISVGRQAQAAKSAAMLTDESGTQIIDNYTLFDGFPQFIIRSGGDLKPSALTWGQLAFCYAEDLPFGGDCNGIVMNGVRYDTPVIGGFSASASWGEDDFWEVAARYRGEVAGFKIALGAGYFESTDEGLSAPLPAGSRKDTSFFQAGGYVENIATGLFLHAAYGHENNSATVLAGGVRPHDGNQWYLKAGLRRNWTPMGATIVYGDYAQYDDQLGPAALALGATSSRFRRYGGGIAQEIDAAAMTVYLKYQRYDASVTGISGAGSLASADFVSAGALVSF